MKHNVLGKYLPLNSLIHALDPRTKILMLLALIIAIFIPKGGIPFLLVGLFVLVLYLLSRLPFAYIMQAIKPMIIMIFFLLVINVLTLKSGKVLFSIGSFPIYADGVYNTLFIAVRLVLMITITTILTSTTKPLDLTLAIEHLLKPLEILKFPSHEVAMMISIALRFIPTIIEETMRIMNAQKSRGVDFEEGKLKEKINAVLSLIVPLFSVAFERAYELADAMEARGYIPGKERTRYRQLRYRPADFLFLIAVNLLLAGVIVMRVVYAL